AFAVGIVDDRDAAREYLFAHLVFQEAHAARYGRPGDRAGKMAEQRAGNARVVEHGHGLRFDLARIEALDRTFGGAFADGLRGFQIVAETGVSVIIVTFHVGTVAGNDRSRDAAAGRGVAAEEAF